MVEAVRKAKLTFIDFENLADIETDEGDAIKRMKRYAAHES